MPFFALALAPPVQKHHQPLPTPREGTILITDRPLPNSRIIMTGMLVGPARTALVVGYSSHPFHRRVGGAHDALMDVVEAVREVSRVDDVPRCQRRRRSRRRG